MKRWAIGLVVLFVLSCDWVSLAADFSGDGTGDIAVFRASSGMWSIRGVTRIYLGSTGDIPVPGDYDGSGADQAAIFRATGGLWSVRDLTRIYFGGSSDEAKPGDYNGDGTDDVGTFRASAGLWAVRDITRVYFGSFTDVAISPGKARPQNYLTVTGQTWSWQSGDDGEYQQGLNWSLHTERIAGATVTIDHNTGLMWAADGTQYGCNWGQWTDWVSAINWCTNLDFAGYTDWRLPNVRELYSITNIAFADGGVHPCVDPAYFPNTRMADYWSSTGQSFHPTGKLVVNTVNPYISYQFSDQTGVYFRSVRGGRLPEF